MRRLRDDLAHPPLRGASCRRAGKIAVAQVNSTNDTHLMDLGAQAALETVRAGHPATEPAP